MCNSTSYSITMKTWKAPKLCKWRKRMWIMDLQCGWQRTRDKLEECYEYIYLFFWLVGSGNDIIIFNLAVQSTGKKQLDFQFLISYKVSGYVCNHGSPSGEQDTVSPRGRYGESRQCDSCLKHTYKNTTCWPATAYDVTTSTTKVQRAHRENTSSTSSSEACIRSMEHSLGDAVSRSPLGEPWFPICRSLRVMSWRHRGFTWKPRTSLTKRKRQWNWLVDFAYLSHSPCIQV